MPSPRNRANHGPSMPCHGPLGCAVEEPQGEFCIAASRCTRKLKEKMNITRASSDADKCRRHRHIADAQAVPRDAPRRARDAVDAMRRTPLQTAEVQQPWTDCGMWGSGSEMGPKSVRSGARPVGGLGGVCPGRDDVAVVTGIAFRSLRTTLIRHRPGKHELAILHVGTNERRCQSPESKLGEMDQNDVRPLDS